MGQNTSYTQINSLEEFSFIGGTEFEVTFNLYDEDGLEIDITTGTVTWTMSPLGQPDYAIVTKNGVVPGSPINRFTVTIETDDTKLLSGKFIHQAIFVDFSGSEFRPNQGIITIIPRIQNT